MLFIMELVNGKVIFITGVAGGIGLCITKELLANGAKGISIVDIAGEDAVKEISGIFGNNRVIFIKTDVTVKEELEDKSYSTMESVNGKVILITGGARGIGFAMVKELLANGAKGAAILDVIEEAGNNAVKEFSATFGPNKVIFIKTDITIKEELEEAFEATIRTFKQLDIVINNAGIVDEVNWKKMIAINFTAVVESTHLAMQKYLPRYKSGEEGVIANTASNAGINSVTYAPVYSGTKHAVVGLGTALGADEYYKKYKVRVLTICPGATRSQIGQSRHDMSELFPDISKKYRVVQQPERIAKALMEAIEKGKSGSVWVAEENEPPYEIVVPDRKTMKV